MEKIKKSIIKPSNFTGHVAIVIPFHGQYGKVTNLVSSILSLTRSNPYQICLVDDASPNKNFIENFNKIIPNAPGFLPQIITIQNEQQFGFGGALLQGYKATEQPWLIFLHSDCLVEDAQWMAEMGQSLLRLASQKVGLIAARSDNPGEGVDPRLKIEKSKRGGRGTDIILEDTYLPLYCVMCHRDLFSRIGGFIKHYPYTGYEDQELYFRMKKAGYKQAICHNSWIHHEGSATVESLCRKNRKVKKIIESNLQRCILDIQKLNISS